MATKSKPLPTNIQKKMEQYRAELLAFGMNEPTKRESSSWHWYFYKPVTELTAFIVNLQGTGFYIEVSYGYTSTAFTRMTGNENALAEWGISDEDIAIRERIVISGECDEVAAKCNIEEMYKTYLHTQKDELLLYAKEKRKAFIQQIHTKLKPLGFKKKGNTWTRTLDETYYLMFNAQKSSFSDQYYFNVYIGKNGTNFYGDCYDIRVAPNDMFPMDWQALNKEDFDSFMEETVLRELNHIIETPLEKLGEIPSYWSGCHCNRQKCQSGCWMKKNYWEAKL